jgi:hypothetical protein
LKKILSILLLSVLIFNSAGYLTGYLLLKRIVKEYTLNYISQEHLRCSADITVLSFTAGTPALISAGGKEITYNNKLYDIVKIVKKSSKVFIYCIEDKKEEALDDIIGDKEESSEDNPLESSFNIFLKNIDTDALVFNLYVFPTISEKIITYTHLSTLYTEPSNQVLIPPPRTIHS